MPRRVACLLALLLPPWSAAIARAQGPPNLRLRETFVKLDANQDTVIEEDEVPESGRAAFRVLLKHGDANGDGKLAADEFRALAVKLRALADEPRRRLLAMDRDGDGKVSRAEFTGRPAVFDRLDADKDGVLTPAEIRDGLRARNQAGPAPAPKPAD